jgi:hypothetical protein
MPAEPSQVRERALPGQIQRQQERIRAKLQVTPDPGIPSPPTDPKPEPKPEPKADPVEPPAPPAPPESRTDRDADPAYWKQRYKVTQGFLNLAKQEHATEVEALNARIAELSKQVNDKATPAEIDLGQYFTPEQIEQHGEDQCKAMAATAVKAARSQAQALIDAEIAPLKTARADDAKRASRDRIDAFKARLAELVPDYPEIDQDKAWMDPETGFLADIDPASGLVRQDILDRHIAAFNAAGVAKMFQAFKASRALPAPPVAPSGGARPGNAPAAAPPGAGYPSKDEIRTHYRRRALRQVSDVEHAAFEARLRSKEAA